MFDMRILFKMVLAPISLFVAFLALMAKWLLTLSSYIVAPLMLYIFGCGMQELLQAQKNIELFFDEEKDPKQTEHSR